MKGKLEEISEVSFNHCICRACEKDFKRNVGSEGYKQGRGVKIWKIMDSAGAMLNNALN